MGEEITFDSLSERYGEPIAQAIVREIEKAARLGQHTIKGYKFSIEGSVEFSQPHGHTRARLLLPSEAETLHRLVHYFAGNDNVSPALLEEELMGNFGLPDLLQLEIGRFAEAVEHLLDLSESLSGEADRV